MNEYKTINQLNKKDKEIALSYCDRFSESIGKTYLNYNEASRNTNDNTLIEEIQEDISYLVINDNIYVDCCDEGLIEQIVEWQMLDDDAEELFRNIRHLNIKLFKIKETI